MKEYCLNIAEYNIKFESVDSVSGLILSERCLNFLSRNNFFDILIRVHSGKYCLPEEAERVFQAPFVSEINGIPVKCKSDFWSVWKHGQSLFIKTDLPFRGNESAAVLHFSLSDTEWNLYVDNGNQPVDPFEYPLDGLILYYLTLIKGDILIHASAVNFDGAGYVFSGKSGKGKTTMARLWESCGAKIIHDDRLIIRKSDNGYKMYNAPAYGDETPETSTLNKLYVIEHGAANNIAVLKDAAAASSVMINCIQHNWSAEIIAQTLACVSALCESVTVMRLAFRPQKDIVKYILENG